MLSGFLYVVLFLVILMAIGRIVNPLVKQSYKKQKRQVLDNLKGFGSMEYLVAADGKSAIALNSDERKLCYIDKTNRSYIFHQNDILDSEIIIDDKKISEHVGVGIGFLFSGISNHIEKVKRIDLKIRVNNLNIPSPLLNFLNNDTYVPVKSKQVKDVMEKVEYWNDKMIVLAKMRHTI